MPVIHVDTVPPEAFHDGATYQTLVGDEAGSTPVRLGLQVSPMTRNNPRASLQLRHA